MRPLSPPPALDRRFEAAVLGWVGTEVAGRGAPAGSVRELLEELSRAAFDIAVVSGAAVEELDDRLRARPGGPGRLLLCAGGGSEIFRVGRDGPELLARLAPTAAGVETLDWLLADLGRRGIAAPDVLVVGHDARGASAGPGSGPAALAAAARAGATAVAVAVEPADVAEGVVALEGGPETLLAILADQRARRRCGELPVPPDDPEWTLELEGVDPTHEPAHESLFTIADGRIGTRGSPVVGHPASRPAVLAAGVFVGDGPETRLVEAPLWNRLPARLRHGDRLRRVLDLRTGTLHQQAQRSRGPWMAAVLFSSLARPGTAVLRAFGAPRLLESPGPLTTTDGVPERVGRDDGRVWAHAKGSRGGIAVAASEEVQRVGRRAVLQRLAAYRTGNGKRPSPRQALGALERAESLGFDALLSEHRAAWAERWRDADVVLEGDPQLQRDVRFALFHLLASVPEEGEAAVGARGMSGEAYRGHVFWDADVFVLPFLAATRPAAARAMLEYRVRRLDAARAAAAADGRAGARFAWESAADGRDVTPTQAYDANGRIVPIRTGQLEEHIVADIAWGAVQYAAWTGDEAFLLGAGRPLVVETARYWASRIRLDEGGRGHLYDVIGPDEYHEGVDDNAFTNVMARWNLRRAAELAAVAPGDVGEDERLRWLELAGALVDGYDEGTGLYEQFAGFWELEPVVAAELGERPYAGDVLLGPERTSGAQMLKQADVLMLHHLVPEELEPGSLEPNLDFYEPRTSHGSSLSPGIHASLLARAGRPDEALRWLRVATRLDLDDLTRSAAGGLHFATLGTVWQALAFGFAGVRPAGEALAVDPRLPAAWPALELRLRFRGRRLSLRLERGALRARAEAALLLDVAGVGTIEASPAGTHVELPELVRA